MIDQGKILIVDDNPTNLDVLLDFLSSAGYTVLVATNGIDALKKVMVVRPELILLDVMMPEIDGFETSARIKSNPEIADIPVIFMTALSDVSDKVRGFQNGAVDYITKPLQHEEVLARVKVHITLVRQRHEIESLRELDRQHYESLSRMKDEVLHVVSHDLKNPINAVTTAAHLLEAHAGLDDDKSQTYLRMIERNTGRMLNLVTDLLDLAQLESHHSLQKSYLPLQPVLVDLVDGYGIQAREKGIQLSLVVDAPDLYLCFDAKRLDQALSNLISNAIKYTPDRGTVTVTLTRQRQNAIITVEDAGLGIPEADIPYLFDKFHRVNTAAHMQQEGTGLGLAIVKAIVSQHGGHVWVNSVLGIGSQFSVLLPLN